MSEQKPPFKILSGNYTWGMTSQPYECWVFEGGLWALQVVEPDTAYYALTIAGRTVNPSVRLRDVQSYIEWQAINDIPPARDEYWAKDSIYHDD